MNTTTDANGGFNTTLRLPDGPHTVVARFSGEGYPIHPSESMPQVVDVSIQYLPAFPLLLIIMILLVAGIVTLSAGGAWYYLRQMSGQERARYSCHTVSRHDGTGRLSRGCSHGLSFLPWGEAGRTCRCRYST